MKVQVYIGEDKLDLFDDEKISVTQKLNDIEKLSSVFTDFTNSFTVPATQNNNRILKHYYDVDINNGFNASVRVSGFIEIDTLPFKFGQFQLEGVTVKQNRADNYKITFYSKAAQLTDLFADDLISQLDYTKAGVKEWDSLSQFNYTYTEANIVKTFQDPTFFNGDLITPLIAYANRDWEYGGGSIFDISSNTYPILSSEVKQALRVLRIVEGIETKYGISFSRGFFGTPMFNQLFMWCNSVPKELGGDSELDFTVSTITGSVNPAFGLTASVDVVNNIFTAGKSLSYTFPDVSLGVTLTNVRDINTNALQINTQCNIRIFDVDANLDFYIGSANTNSLGNVSFIAALPDNSFVKRFKIYFQNTNLTFSSFDVDLGYLQFVGNKGGGTYVRRSIGSFTNLFNNNQIRIQDTLPSMKVIEFIQGIMKMFKLVIRPITPTSFYIDTLDNFYLGGTLLDITKFIDQETVQIDRPVVYNRIQFLYQKTSNVLGKNFRLLNDPVNDKIGYGDYQYDIPLVADRNTLSVELPFENMLFERLPVITSTQSDYTNVVIGQSSVLNESNNTLSPNNSKPILFFNNGLVNFSNILDGEVVDVYPIKFKFQTNAVLTFTYSYLVGTSNNKDINLVTDTLNFDSEIDPWFLQELPQSLFSNYWFNWINTIYSIKQRKFKFEGYLPPRYIQELSLNDKLIIGQNRYKINDYTIDLVTGKTDFNLFNDV
jgi:hypothetical protein